LTRLIGTARGLPPVRPIDDDDDAAAAARRCDDDIVVVVVVVIVAVARIDDDDAPAPPPPPVPCIDCKIARCRASSLACSMASTDLARWMSSWL
jgi:hypothetical protein